jgi:hypothetical protein
LDSFLTFSRLLTGPEQRAAVASRRARQVDEAQGALGACDAVVVFIHIYLDCFSIQLSDNQLPAVAGLKYEFSNDSAKECARRIKDIFAATATTHIGMIRARATEICVGLQDLGLPAPITLAIVDESVHENSIRMWAKWELITAVKHFHQRRGIER